MRPLAAAYAAILLFAGAAQARPYTVDDLLETEDLGAAGFDPSGRWLVVERRGPYRTAPVFDGPDLASRLSGDLLIVDTRAAKPTPRRILRPPSAGLFAGPFSPDGRAIAVIRASASTADVGVLSLSDGAPRWLGLTPQWTLHGQSLVWRTSGELLAIVRPDRALPPGLAGSAPAETVAEGLRRAGHQGGLSATVNGSGRFAPPGAAPTALVEVEVATGAVRTLARGDFDDMELSPSGRYLALLERRGDRPPRPGERFRGAEGLVRRELLLVDLQTGQLRRPCPGQDLSVLLLSWSPTVDQLLVLALPAGPGGTPTALRVAARDARVSPVAGNGVEPAVIGTLGLTTLGVTWLGGQPALYGSAPGEARRNWFLIGERRTTVLTRRLASDPGLPVAVTRDGLLFAVPDGRLLRIDRRGRRTRLEASLPPPGPGDGARRAAQPRSVTLGALTAPDPVSDGQERVAGRGDTALFIRRNAEGSRLVLERAGAPPVTVARLNSHLSGIDLVPPIAIVHAGPSGPVTSWLFRPPGSARPPLVVLPYPGAAFDRPPADSGGQRTSYVTSVQVLAGAGYAVLVPSLPAIPGPADPDAITAQIDQAIDAVLRRGDVDPDRIAAWGHSYGGYATLVLATHSHRYRALIASAPTADLATSWGRLSIVQAATPASGLSLVGAGWAENGQVALGATPWAAPDLYARASPLYAADRVSAPVLLLHGDADTTPIGESQVMFTALQRQGKDAVLVTYFGEGHVIASPANIRDLYGRVLAFLDLTLRPTTPRGELPGSPGRPPSP